MAKLLIAIMSCQKNRATQQRAVFETWVRDVSAGIDVCVFEGGHDGTARRSGHRVQLPCDDSYAALAVKMHEFLSFALREFEFDFIFKCDDDTYVHLPRLLRSGFEAYDYFGGAPSGNAWKKAPYAQGGAYFISRKAAMRVAETDLAAAGAGKRWWWNGGMRMVTREGLKINGTATVEDMMVGDILREQGIVLKIDPRFNAFACPTPYEHPDFITCHSVSARQMYWMRAARKLGPAAGLFLRTCRLFKLWPPGLRPGA